MSDYLIRSLPISVQTMLVLCLCIFASLALYRFILRLIRKIVENKDNPIAKIWLDKLTSPFRWISGLIGVYISQQILPFGKIGESLLSRIEAFAVPAIAGWLALALLHAISDIVDIKSRRSVEGNESRKLASRRQRTRMSIMMRVGSFLIIMVTVGIMMMTIPAVRNIGVTLMASAGLVGLAVGAAAQPMLKNLIAGIQVAFTEPIRIDDLVIVETGDWGWIEKITLTYVTVRLWDERRVIVPLARFLEAPFENWTREAEQLIGKVFLYVDPLANVERLREHMKKVVTSNALWDGRSYILQVSDMKPEYIELRLLATARDAPSSWDLCCDIREQMLRFIAENMPETIAHTRFTMPQRKKLDFLVDGVDAIQRTPKGNKAGV
ncbi:mechanosensitive ion channel MscS [Zymomonas mobilis subsp. mobilis ZM4 = ATCC 31821]|uniref:MscS Mechanosensitive ion channel n=3 Tax=Zymomonas mobilis TaxID=542 RepID=Q5NNU0_ZYMMO|nr:mechanosensitive ion channel family protein [Zymomonas mobilis]AAV89620.2 MscS Mechanosensitive ion channel [Zymomonas mobilis subsp. mobilis ZM4 = ATCC 31821]AVZ25903.1 mechanosensitive ion channel MscS [Zymomonas mobilis subsp. mobilis]AVZ27794.1 mechanosensitive ion channel MscS [Zymomonas mobilis subsp. mobilis]AVZ42241.1 mechanosensitive ion channel MscS [Zymomonas mobilis subsp. mobilis ZM4 = ATCC 31821]UBQ07019.1 mechanosensitive ion channel family protein [Zymomonas mobilis]